MNFYPNQLFHVFNQGNNRQTIFLKDEHYQFFLWKMRAYLLPFSDLVSYCLMPTHFHWLIYVLKAEIERKLVLDNIISTENERRLSLYANNSILVQTPTNLKTKKNTLMTLNESIGILQMSYTKAINKEVGRTGSLFRSDCKAKDGWIDDFITLTKISGKTDHRFTSSLDYAFTCFHYINNNPVEAGLVENNIDWPFSSAHEYAGFSNKPMCNLKLGKEILGLK